MYIHFPATAVKIAVMVFPEEFITKVKRRAAACGYLMYTHRGGPVSDFFWISICHLHATLGVRGMGVQNSVAFSLSARGRDTYLMKSRLKRETGIEERERTRGTI